MIKILRDRAGNILSWLLPLAVGCLASTLSAGLQAASLPRSVLILDQSGPGLVAYQQIDEAFRAHLSDASVTIYSEKLDLNVFGGPEYSQLLETFIREKYSEIPIGVIVAIGARALQSAYSLRMRKNFITPIVFAAVADGLLDRSTIPANVTGRTVQTSMTSFVTAARAIVPDLKRVALVGDHLERQSYRSHFKRELPGLGATVELIDLTGLSMELLKERVATLPSDSAILYTTINIDGVGKIFTPREALKSLAAVANRPIMVDVGSHLGTGAVGGFVLNPGTTGQEAAELASLILNGVDAGQIAIASSNAIKPVFDWNALRRWNVSEARLPAGSEIRFREASVWERYGWQISFLTFAFLVQTALIGVLIIEDRGRRAAVSQSFQLMSELAHMDRISTAGALSASIAHEMRQPLAAIVAFGNAGLRWLSNRTPDIGEARSTLQSIVEAGHLADEVLKNVRSMFANDVKSRSLVDVNRLIEKVLALAATQIKKHTISLKLEFGRSPNPQAYGNEVQLQQVVLNLMLNAIEAMKTTRERARVLTVTTAVAGNRDVIITIDDTGAGIDPAIADKIFQPFVSTKKRGMGVGLSICKSIIEAHGGHLKNIPAKGQGTAFQIVIPSDDKTDE